jgi:hypothetical protein
MKISSINTIKKELQLLPNEELVELLYKVSKYSKDNKELLHYYLFEADFEENYIDKIKAEVDELFAELDTRSWKTMKKSIQKIIRNLKKYIKFSKQPSTEIELLLHFCKRLSGYSRVLEKNIVVYNIYKRQVITLEKVCSSLHEDLQYDYKGLIEEAKEVLDLY